MSITRKEVEKIAKAARLIFNDEELDNLTSQLNKALVYVEIINELDTENITPLLYPVENFNVFREDEVKPSIDREDALKNAPDRTEEYFKVPKVINQ